jgi:uroporphyrinogen-III synthase
VADPSASPLTGKTVFVSRPADQADKLASELEARGAQALRYPLIHFGPPEDSQALDDALRSLDKFDWLIFTSQTSVQFVSRRAASVGISLDNIPASLRVGVVGPATAAAASRAGWPVHYVTRKNQGMAFVEELSRELRDKRVFLPHSNLAIKSVKQGLERGGSRVTGVVAYRTLPPSSEEKKQISSIKWGVVDAVLFFSPSAVQNFVDSIGIRQVQEHHRHIIFVAVGPTTRQAIQDLLGVEHIVQASRPSMEAVLRSLEDRLRERSANSPVSVKSP